MLDLPGMLKGWASDRSYVLDSVDTREGSLQLLCSDVHIFAGQKE